MANVTNRRPLPALVFLLALTLLTSLVWWRVLHRGSTGSAGGATCSHSPSQRTLPRPATVSLAVLNSTSRAGLAKKAAAALSKSGFKVSRFDNDAGHAEIPGVAEIRFSADQQDAATTLSYYIPGATMVHLTTTDTSLVLSLGHKFARVATAAAVQTAMARDKVVYAQTGAPRSPSPTC